jgi:hypothetical protein
MWIRYQPGLAARLKVPKSWVYEMTRSRNPNPLPRLNTGRYLGFDWAQVVEWLTKENGNDPMRKKNEKMTATKRQRRRKSVPRTR